jgi:hypothetical protein
VTAREKESWGSVEYGSDMQSVERKEDRLLL